MIPTVYQFFPSILSPTHSFSLPQVLCLLLPYFGLDRSLHPSRKVAVTRKQFPSYPTPYVTMAYFGLRDPYHGPSPTWTISFSMHAVRS
jgi:hypothetical protein